MVHHAVDSLEILFALVVQFLGLGLELLEAPFGIDENGIFGMLADVELVFDLLRCLSMLVSVCTGI